jgi:23S rRNA (pseudouridine1915-N3)-methyltransferase
MKIIILGIGKTNEKYLTEGIDIFTKRLKHYTNFELLLLPDVKAIYDSKVLIEKETEQFLKHIKDDDFLILCDERGRLLTSIELSEFLTKRMVESNKRVIFLIGGAFGVSESIKKRANFTLSLSNLTFSHQMIRLFLSEQIYRAFTIIKNEKYHNE